MADPRNVGPQNRKSNHSQLMVALQRKSQGEVINFCPFGCQDHQLDDHGYCGHLVGFYNGGSTYEPRKVRKKDKRIIVAGDQRQPMRNGFVLVRITTTARVYSPEPVKELCIVRGDYDMAQFELMEQERKLLEAAENIRNPRLEGVWGQTDYDAPAAAATPPTKPAA